MSNENTYIHPTAIVENNVTIGEDSSIWHFSHIRSGAKIGKHVSIARDGYIDSEVTIGNYSRVQNGVSIFKGVEISKFCFIGPHVTFTNDQFPRVGCKSWHITPTILQDSCSIGAGAIIRCGISIGTFSMIGAGAIVTKSVAPFRLAIGTPAKEIAFICACGQSQFPLHHKLETPILECCRENLNELVLEHAEITFASMPDILVNE